MIRLYLTLSASTQIPIRYCYCHVYRIKEEDRWDGEEMVAGQSWSPKPWLGLRKDHVLTFFNLVRLTVPTFHFPSSFLYFPFLFFLLFIIILSLSFIFQIYHNQCYIQGFFFIYRIQIKISKLFFKYLFYIQDKYSVSKDY